MILDLLVHTTGAVVWPTVRPARQTGKIVNDNDYKNNEGIYITPEMPKSGPERILHDYDLCIY